MRIHLVRSRSVRSHHSSEVDLPRLALFFLLGLRRCGLRLLFLGTVAEQARVNIVCLLIRQNIYKEWSDQLVYSD